MSFDNLNNTYQPNMGGILGTTLEKTYGDLNRQYSFDSWNPPSLETPSIWADIGQPRPTPGFAAKLRDLNSEYGSTIMGGLQAAAGLWGAFNGMQQTKLAKQQMANSLNQWNKNYASQVASYNTRLEDRHRATVAAQGASQPDLETYMAKNRLK